MEAMVINFTTSCLRCLRFSLSLKANIRKRSMSFGSINNIWSPCTELLSDLKESKYGMIILNTPINFSFNPGFIVRLWNQAKIRVTVDGGTERWLTWLTMNEGEFKCIAHPDLITGDMDSITQDILDYYKDIKTTKIVTTPDQDETDFFKALRELKNYCVLNSVQLDTIYVFADTCGRLDQIMANLNTLYKVKTFWKEVNVYQVASSSLSWLLDEGCHEIHLPQTLLDSQDWCALLPVGAPCDVTTTGLKWNLDNGTLKFGGIVSSSNTYDGSSPITVKTSSPVIWSMSIDSLL